MIRHRLFLAGILILTSQAVPFEPLSASCIRVGKPAAIEIEILECVSARDYFASHFSQLHPAASGTAPASPNDFRNTFDSQLASQPGVVLRTKTLRLREYAEPDEKSNHYRWAGPWRDRESAEEKMLYLRQQDSQCDSVKVGTKMQVMNAPQCCDTGYHGEIGCHLRLGMVQALPGDLGPGTEP